MGQHRLWTTNRSLRTTLRTTLRTSSLVSVQRSAPYNLFVQPIRSQRYIIQSTSYSHSFDCLPLSLPFLSFRKFLFHFSFKFIHAYLEEVGGSEGVSLCCHFTGQHTNKHVTRPTDAANESFTLSSGLAAIIMKQIIKSDKTYIFEKLYSYNIVRL